MFRNGRGDWLFPLHFFFNASIINVFYSNPFWHYPGTMIAVELLCPCPTPLTPIKRNWTLAFMIRTDEKTKAFLSRKITSTKWEIETN